ncbi:tyrosine-type recombinase/integrase [Pseudosporangium ferrugineum]|uniref:Site-specific recombinase XerC n=1 Tax=Pseudosporangium ferrugineum TaxID=439699 RepID=A0A2T0RCJ7_9ACTN|nr:site-specific integrase [Pseudosporangium ferrugineum]PRY18877.1 site-specific recombinase XerC [Pseudosporangium ferrugineum]
MSDTEAIVQDPVTGLFGFRLEMGRDHEGIRMQARRSGFTTAKAAKTEYGRLCRQRDAQHPKPRLSDSVQTVCEGWVLSREQELEPNTVYGYRWLFSLIYPYVGGVRAERLSARMVERAYRELEGCGYSRTTLRTLNLVLAKAFEEQVGRTLGAPNPRESDKERPVWSLDEARRFGDHVADDRLYPLWRLLLVTGLRRGELCGLRCGDLEPLQGTLTVRRQLVVEDPGSRVRVKPPKSHNGVRTLVLDPGTLELLGPLAAGPASRYVFAGRWGQPIRPDNLTDRFNQLASAANVRPIGPHQIRHLIASTLLDAGYGVHEVAERLGHDPATLMRYYTRVSAARRLQATDRIAELMTGSKSHQGRRGTGLAAPRALS